MHLVHSVVFPFEEEDSFTCIAGTTALIKAVHNGHQQCENVWIETGADVNATDVNYGTALLEAIRKKDITVMNNLVNAGADVNSHIHGSMTALWQTVLPHALIR